MTERRVCIQIPVEVAREAKHWVDNGDWLSAKINKTTADELARILLDQGLLNEGDNIDIVFRSDENMPVDETKRNIYISDLRLEGDFEVEENVRLVVFKPVNLKNYN